MRTIDKKKGKKMNEVEREQNDFAVDMSAFGGISVADAKPSTIILVQGNHPIKKKLNAKDGDFAIEDEIIGAEFEMQPIMSADLLDITDGNPLDKENRPEYKGEVRDTEIQLNHLGVQVELEPLNENEQYPYVFRGSDGFFYSRKKVFVIFREGMPYRLIFKTPAKQMSFRIMGQTIIKSCAINKLRDPIEGVFKVYSTEKVNNQGIVYYGLDCLFVRPASDDELVAVAPFRAMSILQAKEWKE